MTGAVAALDTVGERDAVVAHPYGMTDLNRRFVGLREVYDCACWADFRTFDAFRAAVSAFV